MAHGRFNFSVVLYVFTTLFVCAFAQSTNQSCRIPGRGVGTCVNVQGCEPVRTFLQRAPKPLSQQNVRLLEEYVCGYQGKSPKVCCPSGSSPFSSGGTVVGDGDGGTDDDNAKPTGVTSLSSSSTSGTNVTQLSVLKDDDDESSRESPSIAPPDVSQHKNLNKLPKECGYLDIGHKIAYGERTYLFQFPWMALLSYGTGKGAQFQCGGTIVNDRYILTAAHCIKNTRSPLIGVRIGEHDIRDKIDCEVDDDGTKVCAPPVQDLFVEETIPHPNYVRSQFIHDIGLLRVGRMNLSVESAKPVCLPLEGSEMYDFTNRFVTVTGWGATETGNTSPVLLRGDIPAISNEECSKIYEKTVPINFRQLCALSTNGTDACGGDSGGPLHVGGKAHGEARLIQQGIVSFGSRNCSDIPGVYTRVAHYMDWILDNLRD